MLRKALRLGHWIRDYAHAAHHHGLAFIYRKPPDHYLGHVMENKKPIILIPGVAEKWNFLKAIADPLSLEGHPIYVLEHLGYNMNEIPRTAELVRELINERKLKDVMIVAHSKGGIVGKYILAFHNDDGRVEKVIAIATPFGGSNIVKLIPHKAMKELAPGGMVVRALWEKKEVNHKIVSIFGVFDNHIWPRSSSYLEGAKNIEIEVHGHHRILSDKRVRELIAAEVKKTV